MSDTLEYSFCLADALAFNSQHGVRYWADLQFIEALTVEFPGITAGPNTEEFSLDTLRLQQMLFDDDVEHDGKFGSGTWAATQQYYLNDKYAEWIYRNGTRVPVETGTKILTWDEDGGLDLHRDGGWSRRSQQPNLIILHWGGRNAKSCRNALASRDLSSHFGVDRGVIYQWLDTAHKAWHAGRPNGRSIGIDICQQPTVSLADWYDRRGYNLEIIDNPSSRGQRKVLTLHPETLKATADLLRVLTSAFDIPLRFPDADKLLSVGALAGFRGIVGHHHVSARKWDVAPWVPSIRQTLGV